MKYILSFAAIFLLAFSNYQGDEAFASTQEEKVKENSELNINSEVNIIDGDSVYQDVEPVEPKVTKLSDNPNDIRFFNLVEPLGAGVWDEIGQDTFYISSKVFYSGGGNVKVRFSQPYGGKFGPKWEYIMYEQSPVIDRVVGKTKLDNEGPGVYDIVYDVRGFVDGSNNKAELFLTKINYPTYIVFTKWWD